MDIFPYGYKNEYLFYRSCLFITNYTLHVKKYKAYYKKLKHKQLYIQTDKLSKMVEGTMLLTVIIGFVQYFIFQRKDHKNFSYLKFILGKPQCDHK